MAFRSLKITRRRKVVGANGSASQDDLRFRQANHLVLSPMVNYPQFPEEKTA